MLCFSRGAALWSELCSYFGDSAWDRVEQPGSRETKLWVVEVRDAGSLNQGVVAGVESGEQV